eukprot:g12735.t1
MSSGGGVNVPEYMPDADPPVVETPDPRSLLMKCCFPSPVVFAWQGCDTPVHNVLANIFCCLFTLCCWTPGPRQKKFKGLGQEKKVCCCECHPKDKCFRFWCAREAIYGWHGCDHTLDVVLMILLPLLSGPTSGGSELALSLYACCSWKPHGEQKVWGKKPMVGQAVAAENYGSGEKSSTNPPAANPPAANPPAANPPAANPPAAKAPAAKAPAATPAPAGKAPAAKPALAGKAPPARASAGKAPGSKGK